MKCNINGSIFSFQMNQQQKWTSSKLVDNLVNKVVSDVWKSIVFDRWKKYQIDHKCKKRKNYNLL